MNNYRRAEFIAHKWCEWDDANEMNYIVLELQRYLDEAETRGRKHASRDEMQAEARGFHRGRKAGLEEAANITEDWMRGMIEQVNSGDATLADIDPEIRMLDKLAGSIHKLSSLGDTFSEEKE